MKKLYFVPFFLYLLPILLFLKGFSEHGFYLEYFSLFNDYLFIFSLIALFHLSIFYFVSRKKFYYLIGFYILGVYLLFGQLKETFMLLPKLGSYPVFIPLLILFPFVFYFFIKKRRLFKQEFFRYINFTMFILCFHQSVLVFFSFPNHDQFKLEKIQFNTTKISDKKPSIHLIVFDAYPGFHSLNKHFSYSNVEIKEFLLQNNFHVFDTFQSNYYQTQHSINSILNLQYLPYLENYNTSLFNKRFYVAEQIKKSKLVTFFKQNSYTFNNNSIFDIDNQKRKGEILSAQSTNYFHFRGVLHRKVIADIGWNFGIGKYKINYFYQTIIMNQHYANQTAISYLLNKKFQKKHFTYSHIMMPHEPYYTDKNGKLINPINALESYNPSFFIEYLKNTNRIMKKIVSHLRKMEPNAIIILMSDHGYRNLGEKQTNALKCDNFMSVYFPDQNYYNLKKIQSNVNLFRLVLNQYFDQKFPILPDKQVWINE